MEADLVGLEAAAGPVLQALFNGLWQGAALAAAAVLVVRLLPGASAASRHVVWWGALLLVSALPLLSALPAAPGRGAASSLAPGASPGWALPAPPDPWPLLILGSIAAVACLRLLLLGRELVWMRRLKRGVRPPPQESLEALRLAGVPVGLRGVRFGVSDRVATPVTIGFRRPMILLPRRLLPALDEGELRQIVVHELAHLSRRDDWTNLAQRILEAVLFFHPAVRWIGRRLELEREIACDDRVVAALAEGRAYARCLTRLAEDAVASRRRSPLAPGIAPGGSQLSRRVAALLAPARPASLRASPAGVSAALVLLLASAGVLAGAAPVLVLAPAENAPVATLRAVGALAVRGPDPPRLAEAEAPPARPTAAEALRGEGSARIAEELAAMPEPRVVAWCAAAPCERGGGPPAIVRRALLAPVAAPERRAARRPATPKVGLPAAAAVEITVALPFAGSVEGSARPAPAHRPGLQPEGRWAAGQRGILGSLRDRVRLRVRGSGSGWLPGSALPGRR